MISVLLYVVSELFSSALNATCTSNKSSCSRPKYSSELNKGTIYLSNLFIIRVSHVGPSYGVCINADVSLIS